MTKVENGGKSDGKSAKSEKERSNKRSHKKEKPKPQTKIVIRHLPPTMTEEEFLKQIDPLPPHDFYYFAAADWSLGYDATCRAYITMKNYDDVFLFRDRFDGYVFVDSKGAEYPAIVEFAPFQGQVKNKSRRVDNKVNTIEQESHYQQFLTKLEEDREAAKGGECKLEFSLDRKKEEKITSTPLLQYLANKKEKRREEAKKRQEEKRRLREEDKEKRKQAQPQVTKIISNQEGGGGGGKGSNKSGGGKENIAGEKNNQQQPAEEGKSSRSQRRAERNQRRREEFERKRQEREQRDKGTEGKTKMENEGEPNAVGEKKVKEQPQQANKPDDGKQNQRKEGGKRYSERRERERNRNRKDKEKEKEKSKDVIVEKEPIKTEGSASEAIKAAAAAAVGGEAIVSESVMNFIRSVATAKEFVPMHKQQEREGLQNKSSDEAMPQINDEKDVESKPLPDEQKKSDSAIEEDAHTQKQRAAEEQRRIRNKDRPSIAIYQPKARLRISEERDPSASQLQSSSKSDTRSNPTSDCESVKKEETQRKKVSRYSERRAERRNNKDKQKLSVDPMESEVKKDAVEEPKLDVDESVSHLNISNRDEQQSDKGAEL
ncbi:regulator of nonsense transcripts 3B [Anastrepha obliqua]|uniref:regulator of nonsense transcripts 3B n=1 Tax=Anastrepha obliqua TaxID=95512 RepID=UPI0024094153|nr:regulator of nonsense transcripts 3B [Anastrepha obliqua]